MEEGDDQVAERIAMKEETGNIRGLQLCLLELLQEIDRICRENNLRYYLFYGTLLGAIRHGGFIPWDDDADILMPRHDYEELLQLAEGGLSDKYFMQTFRTNPYYRNPFAKLRKNNTCCLVPEHAHIKMHHGVFVDIFPLDELPDGRMSKWIMWNVTHLFERMQAFSCAKLPNSLRILKPLQCFWQLIFRPAFFARIANNIAVRFSGKSGSYMSVFDPDHYDPFHNTLPVDDFEPARRVPFEGVEFRVPYRAEKLLAHQYGDYMQLPPEEKRVPLHSRGMRVDLERDYKEYLPELYGNK